MTGRELHRLTALLSARFPPEELHGHVSRLDFEARHPQRHGHIVRLKPRERRFQTALEFAHHAIEAQQVFIRLLQLVDTLTYPLSRFKPQKLMR